MRIFLIGCIVFLSSCEFFKPKVETGEKPIAKAVDNYLYQSDLEGLLPGNISAEDSTTLVEKYVEDWIQKQLMIFRSSQVVDYNEAEIERKVLDYRYALIVHNYEKQYILQNLNTDVSKEDIEKYYEEKSDNFLLKQNIIRCIYAQIPSDAPNINQFRRNFRGYPDSNMEDIKTYCSRFSVKSFLEDSLWVIFDDVIVGTPLESIENKTDFLSRNTYSENPKDDQIHFLKIFEFKISDEISPLEFIREDIKNIIINKRKLALKQELEEKIYNEAREENLFEIYRP
ncbi:MAG: peptidyl-prolyl cis-trans isomerase [Bacteroidota bacterium]